MLVLSRKENQSIFIGDDVEIVVISVDRGRVSLGFKAPKEVVINREEVQYRSVGADSSPRRDDAPPE